MSPEEPLPLESKNKLSDIIAIGRWVERLATGQKLTDSAALEQSVDNERLVDILQSKAQKLRGEGVEFAADELDAIVTIYFGPRSVGYTPMVVVNDISEHSNRALGHSSQEETMSASIIDDEDNQLVTKDTAKSEVQKKLGSVVNIIQDTATNTHESIPQAIREKLHEINITLSSQAEKPEIEKAIETIQEIIDTEFDVGRGWAKAWFRRWNNLENMLYDLQSSSQ